MVLLLIGIAVGIIIAAVLIIKATKTNPREIFGINIRCKRCGMETKGQKCPRCEKNTQTFGV